MMQCILTTVPSRRYEAAGTLVTLSSTPTAVKAAAKCYVELIVHESDNNVKLVVLDKLVKLQKDHSHDLTLQVHLYHAHTSFLLDIN